MATKEEIDRLARAIHYADCPRNAAWHLNPGVRSAWPAHFGAIYNAIKMAERLLAYADEEAEGWDELRDYCIRRVTDG